MPKKVLITSRSFGQVSKEPLDILEAAGLQVKLMGRDFQEEAFRAAVPEFDALIIGAHQFRPEDMARCKNLKLIAKHGAGLDNIYLKEAAQLGICVTNVPATNSNAVADLVFGLMLGASRRIYEASALVKSGGWGSFIGRDVCFKTLGLIGFGAIAQNVARRAKGFSMKVVVYDPYLKALPTEFSGVERVDTLDDLLAQSDFVSIHVPRTDDTVNLISAPQIARMRQGAYLINTSRGGIVNEGDLYDALVAGHLSGAGLDVIAQEPPEAGYPLLTLDNVIITPHIGMYSHEAINAVSTVCAKNVVAVLSGQTPVHICTV